MKITTQWLSNKTFVSANEHGNSIVMDGTSASEGWKRGASPLEVMLMGMSGCTSVDVASALRTQAGFVDCIVSVEAERAATAPKVFTQIHVHYKVIGRGLDVAQVGKIIADSLAHDCSACVMMSKIAPITHSVEVVEA